MKSYPTKFKSFQRKIVQIRALQKLPNSIQTLIISSPVYPIHTNSLFWVIFEKLPFCHFPPPNTSIRTLRAVGFSYAKRERNHCEQPSAFPSSMREFGTYAARDAFDVNFICQVKRSSHECINKFITVNLISGIISVICSSDK